MAIEIAFVLLLLKIEDIVELLQGHVVIPVIWRLGEVLYKTTAS